MVLLDITFNHYVLHYLLSCGGQIIKMEKGIFQGLKFVPLILSTLVLAIASFTVKKNNKLVLLILALIIWAITFLFTIGEFN